MEIEPLCWMIAHKVVPLIKTDYLNWWFIEDCYKVNFWIIILDDKRGVAEPLNEKEPNGEGMK